MTTATVDSTWRPGSLDARWVPDPRGSRLICIWVPRTDAATSPFAPGLEP
jgi:hypothetical protein